MTDAINDDRLAFVAPDDSPHLLLFVDALNIRMPLGHVAEHRHGAPARAPGGPCRGETEFNIYLTRVPYPHRPGY